MNSSNHPRAGAFPTLPARSCRLAVLISLAVASLCGAVTITENFSADPLQNGWQIFGDTNLFHWNAANQNLAVTWDSSQTNSYFYRPFGTILAKSDDFSLSFDLQLADIAAGAPVNPAKTNSFELVVGFINLTTATSTNLERGTGVSSAHGARSVCEFDYFPNTGFGDTVSPTIISSNNQFATQFAFPLTITNGPLYHVTMNYTASSKTLHTSITTNGMAYGSVSDVVLGSSFTDFRFDQIAVCSYSDAGTLDSLLAHGTVDNFIVTVPPPPVQNFSGAFNNHLWQAQFISRTNWLYTLQRTTNLISWSDASIATNGTGTNLFLPDTNVISDKVFYRIRADRP